MIAALPVNPIPIERWTLHLDLASPLQVLYPGSMLRGAFGHSLKALACNCIHEHHADCLYQQIFEPVAPADWPARFSNCPPAYVISACGDARPRQKLSFSFTLLGPCLQHRDLLWRSWQAAGSRGFGQEQITARLLPGAAQQLDASLFNRKYLQIKLTSPLLLKHKHYGTRQSRPLAATELTLRDLLVALHRRLELTHRLYGVPTQLPALAQWLDEAIGLTLHSTLREQHFARHSNRQQQRMPLFGLTGSLTLRGPISPSLLHALTLGQWLHIGGKIALGLGGYELATLKDFTVTDGKTKA